MFASTISESHSHLSNFLPQTVLDELEDTQSKPSLSSYPDLLSDIQSLQTSFTTASSSSLQILPSQSNHSSFHSSSSSDSHPSSFISNINNNTIPTPTLSFLTSLQSIIETFPPQTILHLITTNKGSRHFQTLLTNTIPSQYEITILSNILSPTIANIMCDYYGNYFFQKFIHYCSIEHRLLFYKHLHDNFIEIANHPCGNHSLQSIISLQNTKEEEYIIKQCIEHNLHILSYGQNSTHVIQKVIKVIRECDREYVNIFVISNLVELCLDVNGIGVVKEFIAQMENEIYIMAVVSILENEMNKLTFDMNGNFAIQECMKRFGMKYCGKLINKVIDNIFMFSISKFSSNVVDCVIDVIYHIDREQFNKCMFKIFFYSECLDEMFRNKYANYVIENALKLLFSNQLYCNNNNVTDVTFLQLRMHIFNKLLNYPNIQDKHKIISIIHDFYKHVNK